MSEVVRRDATENPRTASTERGPMAMVGATVYPFDRTEDAESWHDGVLQNERDSPLGDIEGERRRNEPTAGAERGPNGGTTLTLVCF